MSVPREGGCSCGAVRYRLMSDPLFTHCCHCLNCQRQTGSAFVINLLIEADRVEAAKKTVWTTGCRSWYLDDRGVPATWPWPFDRFREEMAAPKLDAYELA